MDTEILIVGAGLCGLHAATRLQAAGRSVLVLEKSRGLGGRAATRRWNNRPVDHGAQFFTAKNPEFVAQVARWLESGVCHEWTRGLHRFSGGQLHEPTDHSHPRYACRSGMAALDLHSPLEIFLQRWRYALPTSGEMPPGPIAHTFPAPLVVAGDWCHGGRIEGAWMAGRDAAERLLAILR